MNDRLAEIEARVNAAAGIYGYDDGDDVPWLIAELRAARETLTQVMADLLAQRTQTKALLEAAERRSQAEVSRSMLAELDRLRDRVAELVTALSGVMPFVSCRDCWAGDGYFDALDYAKKALKENVDGK